ncbi:hypothetical protein [Paralysiella testudinis]|uniref:Uncharacterized protein n=1 Tax=Paralysiella testudinis TaxID=2809020 RepID=A0A892ZBM6_9NEIS|nr:hypothetical protein [Paralysiella testudinis]QRQ80675.1 hypothetical protein JQU52_07805 [Paralysiella testudinis]
MKTVLIPLRERHLSAQEYLREAEKDTKRNNIEAVQFIPPKLGKPGFGSFRVRYKTPMLCEE